MPLSLPVARELSHIRAIVIHGYRRFDGLYDIEASLTDTKAYGFPNEERGFIAPGEPLHGMFMRITVTEDMIGHKFGEFSPTRTFHGHAADKKAKRG